MKRRIWSSATSVVPTVVISSFLLSGMAIPAKAHHSASSIKWPSATSAVIDTTDISIPASWAVSLGAAAGAWNAVTPSPWSFSVGSSLNKVKKDTVTVPAGKTAISSITISGSTITKVITTFNGNLSWSTTGGGGLSYDVQDVATHEFGHWLHLIDLTNKNVDGELTMYTGSIPGSIERRTLHNDDKTSVNNMYP